MPPVYYHDGRFRRQSLDWPSLIPLLGPPVAAVAVISGSRRPQAALLAFPALLNIVEGREVL